MLYTASAPPICPWRVRSSGYRPRSLCTSESPSSSPAAAHSPHSESAHCPLKAGWAQSAHTLPYCLLPVGPSTRTVLCGTVTFGAHRSPILLPHCPRFLWRSSRENQPPPFIHEFQHSGVNLCPLLLSRTCLCCLPLLPVTERNAHAAHLIVPSVNCLVLSEGKVNASYCCILSTASILRPLYFQYTATFSSPASPILSMTVAYCVWCGRWLPTTRRPLRLSVDLVLDSSRNTCNRCSQPSLVGSLAFGSLRCRSHVLHVVFAISTPASS